MQLAKFIKLTGIVLALNLCHASAWAARAGNLFSAEVPVAERSEEAKSRATALALAAVMVKVSGDRKVARDSAARDLLRDADDYIQQFRYTANGTLLVAFDARNLQAAMREAGLPVWGADRPATLMWLVVDDGDGERRIIAADDQGEIRTQIEVIAADRGIPLVWPLNDSVDQAIVTEADVWGGFEEPIRAASDRYAADATLVGKISRTASGAYFGTWKLTMNGEPSEWRGTVSNGIHRVVDFYARRMANIADSARAESVMLQITGLTDGGAYADALSSVEKLGVVEDVQVFEVRGENVLLLLQLRSDHSALRRALSFSRVLSAETGVSNTGETFAYRYKSAR